MLDFNFEGTRHLFGLPERTSSFLLEDNEYRMYSVDLFPHYENSIQNLYSGIPYLIGHNEQSTQSIVWINAAETFVNLSSYESGRSALFQSEAGVMEFLLLASTKSPAHVQKKLAQVTGFPQLPPLYSLGFHYSKWDQNTTAVRMIDHMTRFEQSGMKLDMLWLDIPATNGNRYFTLDRNKFPEDKLNEMKNQL